MRNAIITLVPVAAGWARANPPRGTPAPPADGGEHFADVNLLLHAPQGTNTPANSPAPAPPGLAVGPANPLIHQSTNPAAATTTNGAAATPLSLSGYVPDDKYSLRVGDKISLQILEDRDPPKSMVITDSGELDAPYVGRVTASDKTCKQLADELKALLEKDYYHRATVIISVDAFNRILGRIYIYGQVKQSGPQPIEVNENLTVRQAILKAGGFGEFADEKRVQVIRPTATAGQGAQTFTLNMVEIFDKGKTEKDMVLQPGDSIHVPEKLFKF